MTNYDGVIRRRDIERFQYSSLSRSNESILRDVRLPPLHHSNRIFNGNTRTGGRLNAPNNTPIGTADSASRLGLHGHELYSRRQSQGCKQTDILQQHKEDVVFANVDEVEEAPADCGGSDEGSEVGWRVGRRRRHAFDGGGAYSGDDNDDRGGGGCGGGSVEGNYVTDNCYKERAYDRDYVGANSRDVAHSSRPGVMEIPSANRLPDIHKNTTLTGANSGINDEYMSSVARNRRMNSSYRDDINEGHAYVNSDNVDSDGPSNRFGERFGNTGSSIGRRSGSRPVLKAQELLANHPENDAAFSNDVSTMETQKIGKKRGILKHRKTDKGSSCRYATISMNRKMEIFKRKAKYAYAKALAVAQIERGFPSEPWMLGQRITRSYVFSYFDHPTQRSEESGSQPPGTKKKNRKGKKVTAMQHILGSINVHDFYPGGKRNMHAFYESE